MCIDYVKYQERSHTTAIIPIEGIQGSQFGFNEPNEKLQHGVLQTNNYPPLAFPAAT